MSLTVSVHWLGPAETPRYHGAEWPPAPLRLFQALVASAGRRNPAEKERAFGALRRLETLGPPDIYAPEPVLVEQVRSAVPNNDGDVVWKLYAQGRVGEARKVRAKAQTFRDRRGRRMSGDLHFVWSEDIEPDDLELLSDLAGGVTHLGLGIDLAAVRVWSSKSVPEGIAHLPDRRSAIVLEVPYPGVLNALEDRYRHERARVMPHGARKGVSDQYRLEHRSVGYSTTHTLTRNRYAPFRLVSATRQHSDPPQRGMAVAAMLRHAIGQAASDAGLSADEVAEVMGHGGSGRIWAIPLPNVGHAWADGRIRRVMVSAGQDVSQGLWDSVVRRLIGKTLRAEGAAMPSDVALEPCEDNVTNLYTTHSQVWTSATPVVLTGLDHRRGKPRPRRAVQRLLRFAGIPAAAVAEVDIEPAGTLPGTMPAHQAIAPKHLRRYPRTHVTLCFNSPVAGPLYLGAGVGWGLGLLIACER